MTTETRTMIAKCPGCGGILGAVAAERVQGMAKDIARWIRDGLVIDRMAVESVRKADWMHAKGCDWEAERKAKKQKAATPDTHPTGRPA